MSDLNEAYEFFAAISGAKYDKLGLKVTTLSYGLLLRSKYNYYRVDCVFYMLYRNPES